MRKLFLFGIIGIALGILLSFAIPAFGQVSGQFWILSGGNLKPSSTTYGIQVPSLANLSCIGTNGSGVFQLGTCGAGGGGGTATSSFAATFPTQLTVTASNITYSSAFSTTTNWNLGSNGLVTVGSSGIPYVTASSSLSLPNAALQNSSITVNGQGISLGGSGTITANTPNSVTFNNSGAGGASGSSFNGGSALTVSYNTIGAQVAGNYATFGFPFTPQSYGNSTSSVIGFLGGLVSNGSTTISSLGSGTVNASNGLLYATGTSTPTIGTGLSYSGTIGQFISGISGTLSNTGVISATCSGGTTCSGTNPLSISSFSYPFPSGATTSPIIFSGGLVSNGSTTISSLGSGQTASNNGLLYTTATTTLVAGTNVTFSGGTPVIFGASPITINTTGGGTGVGTIATSSQEAINEIPFFTTVNGYPAKLSGSLDFQWNNISKTLGIATSTNSPSFLTTGNNFTVNAGGQISLNGGGNGNGIQFSGSNATTSGGSGGSIYGAAGTASTTAQGASVEFDAGSASNNASNGTGAGGDIILLAGNGGGSSGRGGNINFDAGLATNGNSNGGNIAFNAGSPKGSGTNGQFQFTGGIPGATTGILNFDGLTTSNKIFTFPNTTGTVCLTSTCAAFPFTPQSYGNSTSSVIGFLGGLFSNGSTTISSIGSGTVNANNGLLYSTATSSVSGGTGISLSGTAGALIGGTNLIINNTIGFPFTPSTNFGVNVNSTSTPINFTQGIMASTTSRFGTTTAIAGFFGTATTSHQVGGGSEAIGIQQGASNGTAIYSGVTNDVQASWLVQINGLMGWGPGGATNQDINFFRNGVGNLTVQSGVSNSANAFNVLDQNATLGSGASVFTVNTISNYISTPQILVNGAGGGAKVDVFGNGVTAIRAQTSAASDVAFSSFVTGDAQLRFSFLGDGTEKWGNGTAVADVGLSRLNPGILAIGNGNAQDTTGTLISRLIGVGTSTPYWGITIASSTGPQLGLTDGTGTSFGHVFRSIAGSLFIATTSPSTFATSTFPLLMFANNGNIAVGTTTPWAKFTIDRWGTAGQLVASSSILVTEYQIATTTAKTIDARDGNSQLFQIGTSATTITLTGFLAGSQMKLTVCNPNASAGAITWATSPAGLLLWANKTTPTQTTTANECDVYSFFGTSATTTGTGLGKIFGAQTPNF